MCSQIVRFTLVFGKYVQSNLLRRHGLTQPSLQRWARDKSLSFVPPDGRFILAEYRYAPNTASSARLVGPQNAITTNSPVTRVAKDVVPLPFTLKTSIELEDHGGTCSWLCSTKFTNHDVLFLQVRSTSP